MSAQVEKRDIMELYGVAIGSSDLSSSPLRAKHVDLIAAAGAASNRLHLGDQGLPIAAASLKPRGSEADKIAADLAPMLWHLKAGGQEQTIARVAKKFTAWVELKNEFTDPEIRALAGRFAAQVVHEWLSSRCARCRGSGKLELDRRKGKVAPRTHARNTRFVPCDTCNATGLGLPNHQQRATFLGIDRAVYDEKGWWQRFRKGLLWLDLIARRLRRPLQFEAGRRKVAPQ